MKRLVLLLGCSGALLCGADLAGVRTVYVMPMGKGLDQYLANRISNGHVFRIVTDPKLADAVLTDAIGENFQLQLETISPTPKPAEPEKAAEPETKATVAPATAPAKTDSTAKPASPEKPAAPVTKPAPAVADRTTKAENIEKVAKPKRASVEDTGLVGMFSDTENRAAPPVSTFGRGKGTIFLVDAKSREVVWSTFDPSHGNQNHDLDRTASDIVNRLRKDLKKK